MLLRDIVTALRGWLSVATNGPWSLDTVCYGSMPGPCCVRSLASAGRIGGLRRRMLFSRDSVQYLLPVATNGPALLVLPAPHCSHA